MKPSEVLSSHKLKRTSCREGIIEIVMEAQNALSENEIREKLSGNYDRTTFYRSFKTLVEHKIIHKIVVDNQVIKYALDNSVSERSGHAHFYCLDCKSVKCLESIAIEQPDLPNGYSSSETEVIIKGTCAFCKKTKGEF